MTKTKLDMKRERGAMKTNAAICAALALLCWVAFSQSIRFGFINFDDPKYVADNAHVRTGLSLANIRWVFTHLEIGLWAPVSSLSHMIDCQLYGLAPGGHHLTNLLIHIAAAMLLFLALRQMTGARWRSAFVAGVFAIHPLRVESVIWIAERKDVLNAFFFGATLLAYAWHVRTREKALPFLTTMACLALGMMAKPMLMTMPFLLLLLDYWPLGRFRDLHERPAAERKALLREVIVEKVRLLVICIAVIAQTYVLNYLTGRHKVEEPVGYQALPQRLANGLYGCFIYLRQLFWPSDTGVIHGGSHGPVNPLGIAAAILGLIGISVLVILLRRKRPYLAVGWFWYLGMLVPVSGLSALGLESHADRYTYLPQIGAVMALTWLVADLAAARIPRWILAGGAAAALATLTLVAREQASYWRDSETLWDHCLALEPGNVIAEEDLAAFYEDNGRLEEAVAHYRTGRDLAPKWAATHMALGSLLCKMGRTEEAKSEFRTAIDIFPQGPVEHDNLGLAYDHEGRPEEALAEYRKAAALDPDDPFAHQYAADLLTRLGRLDEAIAEYQQMLARAPQNAEARDNLALALIQRGKIPQAIEQLRTVIALDPADINAANNLGMILATDPEPALRNGPEALALAQKACSMTHGGDTLTLATLAAAYAECGRYADAVQAARTALQTDGARNDGSMHDMLEKHLALYKAAQPLRDPSLAPGR